MWKEYEGLLPKEARMSDKCHHQEQFHAAFRLRALLTHFFKTPNVPIPCIIQ